MTISSFFYLYKDFPLPGWYPIWIKRNLYNMKIACVALMFIFSLTSLQAKNTSVLVVAGGHSFDTLAFLEMFDRFEGVDYDFMLQPDANRLFVCNQAEGYDVLVFYDMWKEIDEDAREAYLEMSRAGKPMLFMHHALVSYQTWTEFEKIIGGRYVQPPKEAAVPESALSTYKHDVWIDMNVVDPAHPVTAGMKDFRLFDEVYGNYRVGDRVKPLLLTNHPESTKTIAWENRYNNSKIVYIQPGHDNHAFADENYQQLIFQAIRYLAGN